MKILLTLLIAGLLMTSASAFALREPPEKITSFDITFTVRDPNTEQPIEAVFVTILGEAPSLIGQHTSDENGQFSQRLNIGETYTFVLTKEGYDTRTLYKTINSPYGVNLWM